MFHGDTVGLLWTGWLGGLVGGVTHSVAGDVVQLWDDMRPGGGVLVLTRCLMGATVESVTALGRGGNVKAYGSKWWARRLPAHLCRYLGVLVLDTYRSVVGVLVITQVAEGGWSLGFFLSVNRSLTPPPQKRSLLNATQPPLCACIAQGRVGKRFKVQSSGS